MTRAKAETTRIYIYCDPDLKEQLEMLADQERRTLSAQIVKILSDYLKEQK